MCYSEENKSKQAKIPSLLNFFCQYSLINYSELPQGLNLIPPKTCPNDIKAIMELCWKFEPENRCTFDDIVSGLEDTRDKIQSQKELQLVEKDDFRKVNEDQKNFKYTAFNTLLKSNEAKCQGSTDYRSIRPKQKTATNDNEIQIEEAEPLNDDNKNPGRNLQVKSNPVVRFQLGSNKSKLLKICLPLFIFIVLSSTAIWLTVFAVYSNIEAVNGSMSTVEPTTLLTVLSTELSIETSTELSTTTEIPKKEDSEFKNIFCWTSKSAICRKKKNKAQEENIVTKNKP